MFDHLLVATDGSPRADRALAAALKHADGAAVTAVLVVPDYGTDQYVEAVFRPVGSIEALRPRLMEEGRSRLAAVLARHGADGAHVQPVVVVSDRPAEAIVQTAEQLGCDVIVIASRGRGPVAGAVLGSQTQRVIADAKVPVLVV